MKGRLPQDPVTHWPRLLRLLPRYRRGAALLFTAPRPSARPPRASSPRTSGSATVEYDAHPTKLHTWPAPQRQGGPPLPVARNTWARTRSSTPRLHDWARVPWAWRSFDGNDFESLESYDAWLHGGMVLKFSGGTFFEADLLESRATGRRRGRLHRVLAGLPGERR